MIKVKNLDKRFGNLLALNNISLEISRGDKVAIIGENGAGKTTLINEILFNDKQVEFDESIKKGILFQKAEFDPLLKVKEIIEIYSILYDVRGECVDNLINDFNISHILNSNIKKISGGEFQKVKIIIALLNNPDLLIIDEITTGLDFTTRKMVINYIYEHYFDKEKTIILVSHYPDEILKLTERYILLDKGKIKEEGTINDKDSLEDIFMEEVR